MQFEILICSTNHPDKYISQDILWESRERAEQEVRRIAATWSPFIDAKIVEFNPKASGTLKRSL